MKVLVTGASGFIGKHLVPYLEAKGHEVSRANRRALAEPWTKADAVVHLANIAHTKADAGLLRRINVDGTLEAANKAIAAGIQRFVYLSSVKAVDEENHDRPLDGSAVPAPQDAYGRSKLAAEQALRDVAVAKGLEIVVLRPPLVYGPGVKANFLALLRAIDRGWPLPFASIENRRSLIYIGNLCHAIAACVVAPGAAGRTFFVSDGSSVSTPELCRGLARALGKPARLFPFPPALIPVPRLTRSLVVDDAAIRSELGWQPPFTFEQGLRATADWYLRR